MLLINTILHPTDFSESSEFAFQLACSLARDYAAQLVLVHVVELPKAYAVEGFVAPPYTTDLKQDRQRLQQMQQSHKNIQIEQRLVEGDAVSGILCVAEDSHCDLIVMGTHGRTGLGRLLMGSVAEQVVRKASCPVLTVRAALPAMQLAGENEKACRPVLASK
jgi:nucleotide-binding universal stress UspA family protein